MKKLVAILLVGVLLVSTMVTTAFAVDAVSPHDEQAGSLTLSNVIAAETRDGLTAYACEDQTLVTINEDVYWINLHVMEGEEYTYVSFDATHSDELLPVFDCDNMRVLVDETQKTYTMEEYLTAAAAGELDFNAPARILAGSSFVMLLPEYTYVLETVPLVGNDNHFSMVTVADFDGIPFGSDEVAAPGSVPSLEIEETPDPTTFPDVPEDASCAAAVTWAVEAGVTTGYPDGTFRPDFICNRGQVVTFLYRMAGEPEVTTTENPFSDVSVDSPFYNAILWGVETGITAGYEDGTFRPTQTCTSAQVLTFYHRALQSPSATVESPLSQGVNAAYAPAINAFAELGILDSDLFAPNAEATRGEIVTYFYDSVQASAEADA